MVRKTIQAPSPATTQLYASGPPKLPTSAFRRAWRGPQPNHTTVTEQMLRSTNLTDQEQYGQVQAGNLMVARSQSRVCQRQEQARQASIKNDRHQHETTMVSHSMAAPQHSMNESILPQGCERTAARVLSAGPDVHYTKSLLHY